MALYNHVGKLIEAENEFRDLEYAIHRGDLLSEFIKNFVQHRSKKTIIDLGCGKGGLSIAFSNSFQQVYSVDIQQKNIETTQTRAQLRKIENIDVKQGNALQLPFEDNSIDVINNTGVIEWVGCGSKKKSPWKCQLKTIAEFHRVLKPQGVALTATENRFFPYFWIREPHNHSFMLGLLPFQISNFVYRLTRHKKYYHRMLFYSELKKSFKIFKKNEIYVGIPNYQYPYRIKKIDDYVGIVSAAKEILKTKKLSLKLKLQVQWMKYISLFRLTKLLTTNLFIVSKK